MASAIVVLINRLARSNMEHVTLPIVLALVREGGRVCPKPPKWAKLYDLLPNTRRDGHAFIPAAPLILEAWYETPDQAKASRLREHLEWAESHHVLDRVHKLLTPLPESEWHHVGE